MPRRWTAADKNAKAEQVAQATERAFRDEAEEDDGDKREQTGQPKPGHAGPPAQDISDIDADPIAGLRAELARGEQMLDRAFAAVKFAPDHKKAAAERNVDNIESWVMRLRERVFAHDDHYLTAPCKYEAECGNRISEARVFERAGLCIECWLVATGQKPPHERTSTQRHYIGNVYGV